MRNKKLSLVSVIILGYTAERYHRGKGIMNKPRKNRSGEAGTDTMKELQAFAARLRKARQQAGLTQQQVAEAVGLANYVSYQYWERAKRWPSLEYLALLCQKLGVSADVLLGLTEAN